MDLPITLKFFHKIELYQELRRENDKQKNNPTVWNIAKAILRWTTYGHKHLYDPVGYLFVRDDVFPELNKIYGYEPLIHEKLPPRIAEEDQLAVFICKAMGVLVSKGFAERLDGAGDFDPSSIRTKLEGLYMGEVIDDYESSWLRRTKYSLFYVGTWCLVILGVIKIVFSFLGQPLAGFIPQEPVLVLVFIAFLGWLLFDMRKYSSSTKK
jgi:hypothetical protein